MTQATTATTAYPLTPMQEGMLFDCLSTEDPGVHLEQIVLTLEESIDVSALVEAWQVVANRYDVFRTAFSWSEGSPSQSITDAVEIPCTIHNWQSLAPEAQQERLEGLLRQDRAQGIDLAQAPAMRVTVIRFGPQRYRCVWTFHHLVLDGRSFATVLSEVFEAYAELADGRSLSSHADPMAFADYVAWTGTLDHSSSEAFWREFLQGVRAATPLLPSTPDDPAAAPGDRIGFVERKLSASTRARLDEIATTAGCSLNTIVQGAWAILLGRHSGERDVVFGATRAARRTALPGATDMVGLLINTLPVRASIDWDDDLIPWLQTLRRQQDAVRAHEHTPLVEVQRWSDVPAGSALFDSVLISDREELGAELRRRGGAWASRDALLIEQTTQKLTWYVYAEEEPVIRLGYDRRHFSKLTANRITDQLVTLVESIAADPGRTLGALDYIGADERAALSFSEQGPIVAFDARTPVHRLFEAQVARTPDAAALSCLDEQVTYATLNERANQLAHFLVARGVGPDSLVGIYTDRSIEMVLAVLAVHKAGGAYVPLDPDYPAARIEFMLRDAELPIVLTQSHRAQQLPETGATRISLDTDWPQIAIGASTNLDERATGANLAYVIYTSGSTGTPKGVMVEHRNVVNFLGGMDERVPRAESQGSQGTWLAVTSLSFDISVLELMWTLTRGFHVVLQSEAEPSAGASHGRQTSEGATPAVRPLDFSLFYFSARAETEGDPYELLWEGARWADEHGFKAVWTPERHFHAFGGLYPNPAVIGAALAARTEHVEIRSGSVVLPLHHPARVAEEWSVVDRVSNGRVGIAVAAGWMPYDFVLAPHAYAHHRERMFEAVDEVRRLWRGEAVEFPGHDGSPQAVRTLPRPVQPELPLWVTAAGNPETFRQAGAIGANLLTHLLGQSMDELRAKVAIYRQAWEEAGHPGRGTVSLMVHTFVGGSDEVARETVREPMKQYLSTAVNLVSAVAWSFPTLKSGSHAPTPDDIAKLSAEDVDALLDHAFNRYFGTSGLFGSMDTARATLGRIREADVDEVACLIDFGVETSEVVEHLEQLGELYREQAAPEVEVVDYSIGALIERHWITHLQCTPSQAYMLLADEQVRPALSGLQTLLIGGEAFPAALASSLREATPATIVNMYGPTETTIWSSTEPVSGDESMIPIGRPIANTTLYVLDPEGRRVAHGVTGELYIGGAGVVRGYLGRDALTAERFVADPFAADPAARMYRTGDRARVLEDGRVEFLGRLDFQVKIRGHRIELGEIESALLECAGVAESVVIARTDVPGEPRLAAYVVPDTGTELDASTLRTSLRGRLPAYMIPTNFVVMASFPHTPNMKVDRNALPAPSEAIEAAVTNAGQSTDDVATAIERAWAEALGVPRVAHAENFFDLGGDSLMVIRVHARLKEQLPGALSLTDFFQFPTVLDLAGEIRRRGPGAAAASPALEVATTTGASAGQRAAAARRAALARRGM